MRIAERGLRIANDVLDFQIASPIPFRNPRSAIRIFC
jgi:hypothetical protein